MQALKQEIFAHESSAPVHADRAVDCAAAGPYAALRPGRGLRARWLLLLAAAFADPHEAQAQSGTAGSAPGFSAEDAQELDAYLREAREAFEVPGAAVAVIEGGEVVYRGTFGVRGLQHPEPVNRRTRFLVGSISKPMTATLLGTLVDDGIIDWDSAVVDWFPTFSLRSTDDPSAVTFRHLLSHSTATSPNDVASYFAPPDPLALLDQVSALEPVGVPFGEGFDYHNHLFALAGYAGARAVGAPLTSCGLLRGYARLLEQRLFEPTGMTRATVDLREVLRAGNHAHPHSGSAFDGLIAPVAMTQEAFLTQIAPSGGVWASLDDMTQYAVMLLRKGLATNGQRVISEEALQTTQTVEAAFSPFVGYGLGWFIRSPSGVTVVEHAGGTLGFGALLWTVPERESALVILTNSRDSDSFRAAVARYASELSEDQPHAGDADLLAEFAAARVSAAEQLAGTRQVTAAEVRDLAGHYESSVRVFEREGNLVVSTLYGEHLFRAVIDAEDNFMALDNAATGMRLSPERDPVSGSVVRLVVRAPEAAGRLQTSVTLERRSRHGERHRRREPLPHCPPWVRARP